MLVWRLLLGAVFIGGITALCWADYHAKLPGIWLLPLAVLLAILASGELLTMMSAKGFQPASIEVYLGNLAIVAANWLGYVAPKTLKDDSFQAPAITFILAVLVVFVVEMVRYREPGQSTVRLATAIFALSYVGWLITFLIKLRFLGGTHTGMAALAALIVVVKMCDIGAYTVGRLVGRHKMTPRLSGGKTFEGLAGGLVFACCGSWFAFHWLLPKMGDPLPQAPPAYAWLVFGLVVGTAGVLGDLAESLIKRDLGCKDSSTWMPGFGGVLDVLDSLLFASPVAYLTWRWLVA
ncbi:MAG TPA: phosphatidate cytidylyltransferase [Pirellulales bacterium]|nr:phosphatidate cytidylyltransferase [Pirellulales bacterium]